MKYKKILPVALLLLAILTIGAVSASQDIVSDELAADDGVADVQLHQDDNILGSGNVTNWDDIIIVVNGSDIDVGNDDGDDEESNVHLTYEDGEIITNAEDDNYDGDLVFAKVYCSEPRAGRLVMGNENVTLFDIHTSSDENDWIFKYGEFRYLVLLKDISLQGVKDGEVIDYAFYFDGETEPAASCVIETELGDDYIILKDWNDPTKFRIADSQSSVSVIENRDVFSLYCPDGHEGLVTVTVRNGDDEESTFENSISDKDEENLLHWNLKDLAINSTGDYFIHVNANDEFEENLDTNVYTPIYHAKNIYIDSQELVSVEIPSEYDEGTIIVEVDGSQVFNHALADFPYESPYESGNKTYFWSYEIAGYGENEIRTDFKLYFINKDIIPNVEAKTYEVTTFLMVNGTSLGKTDRITIHERNIAEADGVSIEIFDINNFLVGSDDNLALISVPDGADGRVVVTADDETVFEDDLSNLDYDEGNYYIYSSNLDIHKEGIYGIVISYYDENDQFVVENSAYLEFCENFDGRNPFRFNMGDISTVGDEEYNETTFVVKLVFDESIPGRLIIFGDEAALLDVEIPDDDREWGIVGEDGSSFYRVFLKDLTLDNVHDGDRLAVEFYNEGEDNPAYSKDLEIEIGDDYFKFLLEDDEDDGPIDDIRFDFVADDDEGMLFKKGGNITVAYLLIPDKEDYEGTVVTITVTKNYEPFTTIVSSDIEYYYDESWQAYVYPVNLDLTQFSDKDIMEVNVDCFNPDDSVWTFVAEDLGESIKFHDDFDPERLEFGVFYGNLTTGKLNNPDLMGHHFDGNFVILVISDSYGIDDGTVTVNDGDSVVFSKSLSDCEKEYDYSSLGYEYLIGLDEVSGLLPEGKNLTVTFNSGNNTVSQKRVRYGDYLYIIITPEDILEQFKFEITDEELGNLSDDAIFLNTDTNRQSIYIDFGGGYFNVYVNDVKVENLGDISFAYWYNYSNWQYEDDEYIYGYAPDKEAFINYVRSDWGDELELFHLTSWNRGTPELNMTLSDLGITESGTYNIRITHYPSVPGGLDDHLNGEWGDEPYAEEYIITTETEVLNKDIKANLEGTPAKNPTSISISKKNDVITITLTSDKNPVADANIDYTVNGVQYSGVTNADGKINFNLAEEVVEVVATYSGDDNYLNSTASAIIKADKTVADIQLSADDICVGEDLVVNVVMPADVTRRVTVTLNNDSKLVSLKNGTGTAKFSGLTIGTYTVTATYSGDVNYFKSSANTTVKVNKAAADIQLSATDICVGEDLVVSVILPSDVTRRVSVTVGGETKMVSLTDGAGTVKFSGLAVGTYTVAASYSGDANYLKSSNSTKVKVTKPAADIQLSAEDVSVGEDLVVNVVMPADITRRVSVTVNGESKMVSLKDGVGTAKFSGLGIGTYTVTATYSGDANYLKSSNSTKVKVTKPVADIQLSVADICAGEDLVVNVVMPSDVTRRVSVTVGGETKMVSLKDGVGSVKFSGLDIGTYTVSASYSGDSNYLKSSANTTVKVNRGAADIKVTANPVSYGEDVVIDVQLPSDVSRRVSITVGNVTKMVSLTDGVGSAKFSGLGVGTYDVSVFYNGDTKYLKSSANATVKVNKAVPNIQVTANDIAYGETLTVGVKLPADVTKRAVVAVDGVEKYASLKDGIATVKFTGLSEGTHEVQVTYAGDANYKKATYTTTVDVTK